MLKSFLVFNLRRMRRQYGGWWLCIRMEGTDKGKREKEREGEGKETSEGYSQGKSVIWKNDQYGRASKWKKISDNHPHKKRHQHWSTNFSHSNFSLKTGSHANIPVILAFYHPMPWCNLCRYYSDSDYPPEHWMHSMTGLEMCHLE